MKGIKKIIQKLDFGLLVFLVILGIVVILIIRSLFIVPTRDVSTVSIDIIPGQNASYEVLKISGESTRSVTLYVDDMAKLSNEDVKALKNKVLEVENIGEESIYWALEEYDSQGEVVEREFDPTNPATYDLFEGDPSLLED